MVWGKNAFRREYQRLLPELEKVLREEGDEIPENIREMSEQYEYFGRIISGLKGKHPGDLLGNYFLTEIFINAILMMGDKGREDLRKIFYSELKKDDAKKLELKYLSDKIESEDVEHYGRSLLILLGRNQFLQLCKKYFSFQENKRKEEVKRIEERRQMIKKAFENYEKKKGS